MSDLNGFIIYTKDKIKKLERENYSLREQLASAKAMEERFKELKSIVSKCQPDEVCIDNALLYLDQLEGKG